MNIHKKLTRSLAAFMTSILGLSLFTFAPVALALPVLDFVFEQDAEYRVYEGMTYDLTVELTGYEEDTAVDFYVKGPLGEPGETEELVDSYGYITNEDHIFVWDGKMSGNYVEPGTYELRFEGTDLFANDTNVLTHEVDVTEETNVEVTSAPNVWWSGSGSDYEVQFDLETAVDACVNLSVDGELVATDGPLSNGSYSLTWDGELSGDPADNGPHDWKLYAEDTTCGASPAAAEELATGTVTVVDVEPMAPSISGLGMTIDPFSPDDDGNQDTTTVTFDLSANADVTVSIENGSGVEVVKLLDSEAKTAGTVNTVWDGKETGGSVVPDGTYTVKVEATNAFGSDSGEVTVDVDTSGGMTEPPSGQCAGYTDVDASHPNCDAIEYVQSLGAMTGNPDGTFDPNEVLQRDQVAKISLETFGLFDDSEDYCGGTDPFPDVTSSAWSYQYVCRGVELGMITGYEGGADAGYYRPARAVNRVEFLALVLRNLSDAMPSINSTSYDDVETGQWFSGFAKYSQNLNLFEGANLFPTRETKRVEVAEVIYKLHQEGKI